MKMTINLPYNAVSFNVNGDLTYKKIEQISYAEYRKTKSKCFNPTF